MGPDSRRRLNALVENLVGGRCSLRSRGQLGSRRERVKHFQQKSVEVGMGILLWIVFGLVAGVMAKWLIPGRDPGGIFITILLGIGGAIVGGMIATSFGFGEMTGFDIRSLTVAILGAMLLLVGYRFVVPTKVPS